MHSNKLYRSFFARFFVAAFVAAAAVATLSGHFGGQTALAQRVVSGQTTSVGGKPACDCTQSKQECGCVIGGLLD